MRRRRAIPMPTREERERAKLKATSADPLVWAMKSVDERFPDTREKDAQTIKAENEVEEKLGPVETGDEVVEAGVNEDANFAEEFGDDFDDDFDDDDELLDDSDILTEPDAEASVKMINKISALRKKDKETKAEVAADEKPTEIKAEGKLAMPLDDGVVTMEVTPMRQNVSNIPVSEVRKASEETVELEAKSRFGLKKVDGKKTDEKKVDDKKKIFQPKLMNLDFKQKKMMIGFAVLVIVAVAGVCFGVIATVKQSQATEELKNQIIAAENSDDDEETTGEYINLKDWGIKIKIVEGLDNVSYNTITDDYAEVQIWASKRDTSANYVPTFAKQTKNSSPLGTMVRVPRYERAAAGRLIWYDDYYNYYYQGPSGVPKVSEDEMSWWVESYLLVKEMLTNADNYTSVE